MGKCNQEEAECDLAAVKGPLGVLLQPCVPPPQRLFPGETST